MDYNIELRHEYAIGGLDQIKTGNLDDEVTRTFDLNETKSLFLLGHVGIDRSSLILPKIIGAYRRVKITVNPIKNRKAQELRLDHGLQEGFDVHPSLVQIGFEPEFLTREIVSDYIGPESTRIRIVPYEELRAEGEDLKKLSALVAQRFESPEKKPTDEVMKLVVSLAKSIKDSEGLTRPEYDLMMNSSEYTLIG